MAQVALTAATTGLQMIQQRQQQKAQERLAQQQADATQTRLRQGQDIRNRQHREVLKKQLASRRAAFGAAGLGGRGGSADAVLQGLSNDTARAIHDEESHLASQIGGLNAQVDLLRSRNLLERRSFLQRAAMNAALGGAKQISLLDQ